MGHGPLMQIPGSAPGTDCRWDARNSVKTEQTSKRHPAAQHAEWFCPNDKREPSPPHVTSDRSIDIRLVLQ